MYHNYVSISSYPLDIFDLFIIIIILFFFLILQFPFEKHFFVFISFFFLSFFFKLNFSRRRRHKWGVVSYGAFPVPMISLEIIIKNGVKKREKRKVLKICKKKEKKKEKAFFLHGTAEF